MTDPQPAPPAVSPDARRAAIIRGGATRLARRLRSERPDEALSSNKISLLSHLARHGACARAYLRQAEHHMDPFVLERTVTQLAALRMLQVTPAAQGSDQELLSITQFGLAALGRDLWLRDVWLIDALKALDDTEVEALCAAAAVMSRIAELPGLHQHTPAGITPAS